MRTHLILKPIVLLLTLAVAACASRTEEITGSVTDDYRTIHPIVVTRGMATLDLLPGGGPGGLTDRQVGDIQEFAREWRKKARGQLTIHVPAGGDPVSERQSSYAVKEIRRIFGAMGVPRNAVGTVRYSADGPGHLAPVRLEFPVLEAKVPHECGQWPDDMGYYDLGASNSNRSHLNYGCAYQQNMAAQIEDPEDLIRPRSEDPAMATRRTNVLDKFGKGEPTVTQYPDPKLMPAGQ